MNALIKGKSKVETVVSATELQVGEAMEMKARAFGASQSAALGETINRIAKAKQDYQGGPFAVMFTVTKNMTGEQLDELPHPASNSGQNPAIYKVSVIGAKGKRSTPEHKYYNVVSDNLACNVAKQARIDLLELSLGDPTKVNMSSVPADIQDMDKKYREAEIARLKGELATSRRNVNEAFELLFHIREINELPGVEASVIYAIGPDGLLQDGEDGRESVVENTTTPISLTTTVEGRKGIDTCLLSVGSFKKLDPKKASEKGGTYQALIDTAQRGTKSGTGSGTGGAAKPERIATNDTLIARMVDIHAYMDEIASDTKQTAFSALLNQLNKKEGSADLLMTMTEVRDFLNDLLGKTYKAGERYQELTRVRAEAEAKKAA